MQKKIIVASNNNPDKETPIIQKKRIQTNTLSPREHLKKWSTDLFLSR